VIDESKVAPGRSQMAALAPVGRSRVRLRLAGSRHGIVAADALCRRAVETPSDVARRTGDADVRAGERKTCRKMIKWCRQRRLSTGRQQVERDERQDGRQYST